MQYLIRVFATTCAMLLLTLRCFNPTLFISVRINYCSDHVNGLLSIVLCVIMSYPVSTILSSEYENLLARLYPHNFAVFEEPNSRKILSTLSLPSIKPPVRVLIRTRPTHFQKIHPSFDQADTELIERLCDKLSITDKTKISHLITRLSDEKKSERVDIIFDYGSPIVDCQPPVITYAVTVDGLDLIVKQLSNPQTRPIVNRTVEAYRSINLETCRSFPNRPDIRAETRRKRLAMLPVSKLSSNVRNLDPNIFTDVSIYAIP